MEVSIKNNKCRDCGGKAMPSKGIISYHDIRTQDKTKEFITKIENCVKCEDCGHSWINLKQKQ